MKSRDTAVAGLASVLGAIAGMMASTAAASAAPAGPYWLQLALGILGGAATAGVAALYLAANILHLKPVAAARRLVAPFGVTMLLGLLVAGTAIGIARSRNLVLPESTTHTTVALFAAIVAFGGFGGLIAALIAPLIATRGGSRTHSCGLPDLPDEEKT